MLSGPTVDYGDTSLQDGVAQHNNKSADQTAVAAALNARDEAACASACALKASVGSDAAFVLVVHEPFLVVGDAVVGFGRE